MPTKRQWRVLICASFWLCHDRLSLPCNRSNLKLRQMRWFFPLWNTPCLPRSPGLLCTWLFSFQDIEKRKPVYRLIHGQKGHHIGVSIHFGDGRKRSIFFYCKEAFLGLDGFKSVWPAGSKVTLLLPLLKCELGNHSLHKYRHYAYEVCGFYVWIDEFCPWFRLLPFDVLLFSST